MRNRSVNKRSQYINKKICMCWEHANVMFNNDVCMNRWILTSGLINAGVFCSQFGQHEKCIT